MVKLGYVQIHVQRLRSNLDTVKLKCGGSGQTGGLSGGGWGGGGRFDLVTSIPITWIDWAVIQVRHATAARRAGHARHAMVDRAGRGAGGRFGRASSRGRGREIWRHMPVCVARAPRPHPTEFGSSAARASAQVELLWSCSGQAPHTQLARSFLPGLSAWRG